MLGEKNKLRLPNNKINKNGQKNLTSVKFAKTLEQKLFFFSIS